MLAYLNLTKPRISLLFAITGLTAILVERNLLKEPLRLWMIIIGIFLVGGSANAFNQYFEREIDKIMTRTANRRPLPQGKISPLGALLFSLISGMVGTVLLWYFGNILAAFLGLGTILFYSFYYTLWLKPRAPYNIVIGGIAGAMGPVIAWVSATGTLNWIPILMFLIIFFWTPPHFWALALYYKEDYKKVSLPMLPLVIGDAKTRNQIFYYSLALLPLSLSLYWIHAFKWFYGLFSLLLSLYFIWKAFCVYRTQETKPCQELFRYSIAYLMGLFLVMIVDTLL